ncbi:hypothetical protein BDZ97DRAFT_1925910 [Flammula alnicola]|nr:hypothetical protein BDZ97DRAFT_1925910 [Flammula alnicola]
MPQPHNDVAHSNVEENDPQIDTNMDDDGPDSQIWTAKEKALLKAHVEGYRAAPRKTKASYIVNTVIPKIKELWKGRYSKKSMNNDSGLKSEWAKKKKSIFNWFPNHAPTERRMKIPGFNLKVTFDSVVAERKKKEIEEEAKEQAGGEHESKHWIKYYQGAKKAVKEGLSDEERAEYEREVEEWKTRGVPKEVQAATVARRGNKIIREMDKLRWNSMRMRTVAFECHYKADGKIAFSSYDTQSMQTNVPTNVPTFLQFNPTAHREFKKAYVKYIKHISSLESGTQQPTVTAAGPTGTIFKLADLQFNPSGLPRVPDVMKNTQGIESSLMQQSMIRVYWTKHYALARGKEGKVPFTAIALQSEVQWWTNSCNTQIMENKASEGELPFKFNSILGRDKTSDLTEYPDGIFNDFHPAMSLTNHRPPSATEHLRHISPDGDEDDPDSSEEFRLPKAAWDTEDDEEEGDHNSNGAPTSPPSPEKTPSVDRETSQEHMGSESDAIIALTRTRRGFNGNVVLSDDSTGGQTPDPPRMQDMPSSPTVLGSSPGQAMSQPVKLTSVRRTRGRSARGEQQLVTPAPSGPATPAPVEATRQLRSTTKKKPASETTPPVPTVKRASRSRKR